jgi:60 kDa SS-A/Ro ribonucleoprotein
MVAPVASMSQDVWQELFESMPVTATLRNLANLTTQGVLCPKNRKNLARLEGIFLDKAVLKKALVHPLDLLKAWKTYASGGLYGRSSKTYVPVQRIVDILEESLTLSFETIERTDKVFLHGLDISGSMGSNISSSGGTLPIRYCEVAALMALVTARAEPNYYIKGFSSNVIDLKISARSSFGDATREVVKNNFGGTDAGKVYQWAITEKVFVDTFVFWTDGENWAGYHPSQLLKKYRGAVNPEAKAIYVTLTPGPVTLVDPKDPQSFDLAGFDPSIPKMVQMISSGELS